MTFQTTQHPSRFPTAMASVLLRFLVLFTPLFNLNGQGQSIPENPQQFHIFLLMGQSNMAGGSATDGPMDTVAHPRIFKLDPYGSWVPAVDPVSNIIETGVGPGMSFAKRLVSENPSISVGLISLAEGATNISQWSKGSNNYNATLAWASYARSFGVIKGILWHQGEHDAIDPIDAYTYYEDLEILINDLRVDLKDVEIPFIIGGFASGILDSAHIFASTVWDALKAHSRDTYLSGYARTEDLKHEHIHFMVEGQLTLGKRYADAYLQTTGHWTAKFKDKLDTESTLIQDGWKYHPMVGLYFDEHYPLIKHAQMNWVTIEADEQLIPTFHSRFFGSLKLLPDPPKNGLYLYRPSLDPEKVLETRGFFFVNLVAEQGSRLTFYDHTTETFSSTIGDLPTFQSHWDFNRATEFMFRNTQSASVDTINSINNWNHLKQNLKETEETRLLTILLAQELFWYAHRNLPDPVGAWWKEHAMGFLTRIDMPLLDAQIHYQKSVNQILSNNN